MKINEMSVNERVKLFCKVNGLSVTKLAAIINIPQTTLNGQLSSGGNIQFATISSLLVYFPDLSAEWLLRGEGEMGRGNSGTNIHIDASGDHVQGDGNITHSTINNTPSEELITLRIENKMLKEQVDDLRKDKELLTKLLSR